MTLNIYKLAKKREERAELMVEYALLIGIIVTALMSMQTYMKRGVQGVIKTTADNLAAPINTTPDYSPPIKDLDSQVLGIWEPGLIQKNIETAPTITAERDITLTETPPVGSQPTRVTTINKDQTTSSEKLSVVYVLGQDQTFTASDKMKADKGISPVQAQPIQSVPLGNNIK